MCKMVPRCGRGEYNLGRFEGPDVQNSLDKAETKLCRVAPREFPFVDGRICALSVQVIPNRDC